MLTERERCDCLKVTLVLTIFFGGDFCWFIMTWKRRIGGNQVHVNEFGKILEGKYIFQE